MQAIANYMLNLHNENELALILQRLTSVLSSYLERPTSAIPKKDPSMNYIDQLMAYYLDQTDWDIIDKLMKEENEFVLAAFDLFKSDKDQENLVDTL